MNVETLKKYVSYEKITKLLEPNVDRGLLDPWTAIFYIQPITTEEAQNGPMIVVKHKTLTAADFVFNAVDEVWDYVTTELHTRIPVFEIEGQSVSTSLRNNQYWPRFNILDQIEINKANVNITKQNRRDMCEDSHYFYNNGRYFLTYNRTQKDNSVFVVEWDNKFAVFIRDDIEKYAISWKVKTKAP